MHHSDYAADFGNHNYGCNLMFHNNEGEMNDNYNLLISLKEVLDMRQNRIKKWSSGVSFQKVYQNVCDRRQTNQGIIAVLNNLFIEIYGGRIQCIHLIH